jgi:glycosyltransferase involved in cell wall biosynthesis
MEISADALARALAEALTLSENELAKIGHRGRELVESSYLWERQGKKATEMYEWLLGRRGRPDFVITN